MKRLLALACLALVLTTGLACQGTAREEGSPSVQPTGVASPKATQENAPTSAVTEKPGRQQPPSSEELLGPLAGDASVKQRLNIDMDGDGVYEVAMVLVLGAPRCGAGARLFALWRLVDDRYTNILAPEYWQGAPPTWIPQLPPAPPACDLLWHLQGFGELVPLDFTGDGTTELAVSGVPGGCGTCDQDIGILDIEDGRPRLLFERLAGLPGDAPLAMEVQDGDLRVSGYYQTALDSNCCPSAALSYLVSFDRALGYGTMRGRKVEPLCTAGDAAIVEIDSNVGVNRAVRVTCDRAASSPGGTLYAFGAASAFFDETGKRLLEPPPSGWLGKVEVAAFDVVTVRASQGEGDYFLARELRLISENP